MDPGPLAHLEVPTGVLKLQEREQSQQTWTEIFFSFWTTPVTAPRRRLDRIIGSPGSTACRLQVLGLCLHNCRRQFLSTSQSLSPLGPVPLENPGSSRWVLSEQICKDEISAHADSSFLSLTCLCFSDVEGAALLINLCHLTEKGS